MISLNYINQSESENPFLNEFLLFESVLADRYDEVETLLNGFKAEYYSLKTEAEILGDDSNLKTFLESEEKKENNVFAKIGDKVKALVQETVKFLRMIINKIRDFGFQSKSDAAKLDKLIAAHPELKDKVMAAFRSGDLTVRDINSFKELEHTFDEIMKANNADPKSLKAKWDKAWKKFEDGGAHKIIVFGQIAAAVVSVATLISKLQKSQVDSLRNARDVEAIYAQGMKEMFNNHVDAEFDKMGDREIKLYASRAFSRGAASVMKDYQDASFKMQAMIAHALDIAENALANDSSNKRADARAATMSKVLATSSPNKPKGNNNP